MTTAWLLLLVNIATTWCCSTIHVSPPDGATVIGRTMELENIGHSTTFGGMRVSVDLSEPDTDDIPYNVSVHRRNDTVGYISAVCELCKPFKTQLGYVSVDLVVQNPVTARLTTEGMNEAGLTVSTQVFSQTRGYMQPSTEASDTNVTNVCFAAFADWILGTFDSVKGLREALNTTQIKIVGLNPNYGTPLPSSFTNTGLHWSIDDASEHIVLEVLDGIIHVHNNTVGVMTNQPDFTWHLRNLNNFVNLRSSWPSNPEIQVQTEVGPVPNAFGHGFNLLGIPGDYSPPSRFVRLFYLREYAVFRNPPKERKGEAKYTDSISLVDGLLHNVFINKGTVSEPPNVTGFGEYSQYTVIKIPEARLFFYRDYVGTQWRKVKLENLDFSPKEGAPPITVSLNEGTLSIKDVTADFTAPPPASPPAPPAQCATFKDKDKKGKCEACTTSKRCKKAKCSKCEKTCCQNGVQSGF